MYLIPAIIILASLQAQVPESWLDTQLDPFDRQAIEQLISFAPPPIEEDATWILPANEKRPSWSDYRGKVVVIQSWSNTNPRARQIIGATNKVILRTTSPEDVVVVTIHIPEGLDLLGKYQSKHTIQVPTIIDSTGELCNKFGFYTDPTNVVIDRNGAVTYVGLGIKGLIEAVNMLLEQPHDPDAQTEPFVPKTDLEMIPVQFPEFNSEFGRAKNQQGNQAPVFRVEQWLSEPVDVQGKIRVIEFWATWCAPCKKVIPHMNEYASHFKNDVVFVGVSKETPSIVKNFLKTTPMNYGVAIDTKSTMQDEIACIGIPLSLVVSSDGIVRWQGNPLNLSKKIIQQIVSADHGESVAVKRGRWEIEDLVESKK